MYNYVYIYIIYIQYHTYNTYNVYNHMCKFNIL